MEWSQLVGGVVSVPSDTIGHSNVTGERKQKLYEYVVIDGTGGYGGGEVKYRYKKEKER